MPLRPVKFSSPATTSNFHTPVPVPIPELLPAHTCTEQPNLPCPACVRVDAINRARGATFDSGVLSQHLDNARTQLAFAKDRADLLNYPDGFRLNIMVGIRLINKILDQHREIAAKGGR